MLEHEKPSKPDTTRFVVDQVEGERATLVAADDDAVHFTLPLGYLPAGTKEGDHLRLTFKVDKASREKTAKNVKSLLARLSGEDENE